jgi:hypothetical protein
MKLSHRIRHYWHELYYFLATPRGVHFAMNCKDVTEKIDLHEMPAGFWGRFRFWLHISFCQACKNYLDLSQALRRAIRGYTKIQNYKVDLNRLTQSLLQKYSAKK